MAGLTYLTVPDGALPTFAKACYVSHNELLEKLQRLVEMGG